MRVVPPAQVSADNEIESSTRFCVLFQKKRRRKKEANSLYLLDLHVDL